MTILSATMQGLVLASGTGTNQKSIYGSKQTLENLASAMNGGVWPVLGSYEESNGVPYVWRKYVAIRPIVITHCSVMIN